jgi:GAF domain-containing protein
MVATYSAVPARGACQAERFGIQAAADRVLQELARLVPSADGAIVGALDASYRIRTVRASGTLRRLAGASFSLDASLSGLAVRSQRAFVCDDASRDDRVDRAAATKAAVSSLVCVPLARDGASFGVLAVAAHQPRAFCALDVAVCKVLAEALSAVASAGAGTFSPGLG